MDNLESNIYREKIQKDGAISFVPRGNSMWPILKNKGQSVVVEKLNDRLNKFDVALYCRKDNRIVLHRVMEVKENGYIFCGDSQYNNYEFVEENNVIGKLSGFYKGKTFISVDDKKYKRKVERWYSNKLRRKITLKLFYFARNIYHFIKGKKA